MGKNLMVVYFGIVNISISVIISISVCHVYDKVVWKSQPLYESFTAMSRILG